MAATWQDVRNDVLNVEPTLAGIIDAISPDKSYRLYKVQYPYGSIIADPQQMYLPSSENDISSISSAEFGADLFNDLGYGKDSWAMGVVLEKNIEVFIDLKDSKSSIPWMIYKPGTIFPYAKLLNKEGNLNYAPNNILTIVSGARSAFMLPNIGCYTNHISLQKDFHVQSSTPKSLYEHWQIFKEITSSKMNSQKWHSTLLYFSEKWVRSIKTDNAWAPLKAYLYELAWSHFEYRRNYIYYDIAYSRIQKKRNLKPNPYLMDTASHLFSTALGAAPGYAPACNNESLPLDVLQQVFIDVYGLKKYVPTVMQPSYFQLASEHKLPVYYSMQNPSTFVFSPKSRKVSSTLFELQELEHIMKVLLEEIADKNSICAGTVISDLTKLIRYRYFHNESDRHRIIRHSSEIENDDSRFSYLVGNNKGSNGVLASDAKFLRGCIGIYPQL